ncbi:WYL domain-containing protein [Desulfococcaceae bacterium OttesenSCG-928-F15]|nr:WYL domain-containing protein [Desulfococcaceae bacterium OttesenSCG-928-F15]
MAWYRKARKGTGFCQVQATVADTSQLHWWLLGFGPQVEVLAPKFLRKEFKIRAQDLANIYKKEDV